MEKNPQKVLAAGTFDLFHKGHESFLEQAKQKGHTLFVIVARDKSVKKIKGFFPEEDEAIRLQKVKKCVFVDEVFLGDSEDFLKIPKQIDPDIIVLGYDQKPPRLLQEEFSTIPIIPLESFQPDQFKSSFFRKQKK